jgi:glutathione peroxidase
MAVFRCPETSTIDLNAPQAQNLAMDTILSSFKVKAANGSDVDLAQYKNKVAIVVNVASKCGFTPQYEGLERLYEKYKEQGLVVLGFPCNQFSAQEPGSDAEIQQFCSLTYGVKFPVFAKVDVNGDNAAPIFTWLKSSARGFLGSKNIKWNFTKFLVGRDGRVQKRFATMTKPEAMEAAIVKALGR